VTPSPETTLMLTYEEAGEELRVSAKTIERMVRDGTLSDVRLTPRLRRIRRVDLERWVKRQKTTAEVGAELMQ
jgi:excisionase family DNA binding protein